MAESRRLNELRSRLIERAPAYPGGKAVIALSGGADSAVAAWLTLERGSGARAIHIDHGLPASHILRRAAEAVAATLGIELDVKAVTVGTGASPEDQARIARYQSLLEDLAEDEYVVTGHTADDQAETVLMNILRGTGLGGLAGIPVHRPRIFRPILGVTRSETRELATLLQLPWHDDPANRSADPVRNRIRNELVPLIESEFNPRFRRALLSLAETAAAAAPVKPIQVRRTDDSAAVARPELFSAGRPAAQECLREELRRLRGPHAGVRAEIDRLMAVAKGDIRSTELSGGLTAMIDGPWLLIRTGESEDTARARQWRLPGEARFGNWSFRSMFSDRPPRAIPFGRFIAVADAERVDQELSIRTAVASDQIDGADVFEVLRRVGIPPERRRRWPLVEARDDVIWVPGARISRSVWVGAGTRRYLWVHAELETL